MKDFPKRIKDVVGNLSYKEDFTGCSEDHVYNFQNAYILKVSSDLNVLKDEYDRIKFLNDINFPSSKIIDYFCLENKCYLLRTCINGDSLISDRFLNNPVLLLDVLKETLSEKIKKSFMK